jgi:hypothetical protein
MSDRDWDAELRKIDKQMEKAAAAEPVAPARAPASGVAAAASVGMRAPLDAGQRSRSSLGVFARLGLVVALGVGIIFWPYAARCGPGLALYLGAVVALVVGGSWSAVSSFRHHAARAHLLSLLIVLWGLVLAGMEVLPRVGYAIPTVGHPAVWSCAG